MTLPPHISDALNRLEAAGFSAYAVGGCVRDALRGVEPEDYDLATAARPEQVTAVFCGDTVLPTGLRHGTVTVMLRGQPVEITTFRADGDYGDGRRPDGVVFHGDVVRDLARRDFTVNAMAYHPARGLTDPFGGRRDLADGVIRAVGEPRARFTEDALRILRALRFASTLGFAVEADTARAAISLRHSLARVAPERVGAELIKLLCGGGAGAVLRAFREIAAEALPPLRPLFDFPQSTRWHCYDVYEHTLRAVEAVPPTPVLRLAALLHDSGKPACYSYDGSAHFHGHPAVSAALTQEALTALRLDRRTVERVTALVREHDKPLPPTEAAVRRRLGRLGEAGLRDLLALRRADVLAQHPDYAAERLDALDACERLLEEALAARACVTRTSLAVNGRDLLALGIPADRRMARVLDALLDAVLEGQAPNERAALLVRAGEVWRGL